MSTISYQPMLYTSTSAASFTVADINTSYTSIYTSGTFLDVSITYPTTSFTTFSSVPNTIFESPMDAFKQWETPEHIYNPDEIGLCRDCHSQNNYRSGDFGHAPLISEEPDWRDLLAS